MLRQRHLRRLAVRQRIKDSTKDRHIQYQDLAFKLLINIDRYDFHRFSAALHTWDRVDTFKHRFTGQGMDGQRVEDSPQFLEGFWRITGTG
jgi:hypothetical protein